MNSSSGSGPEPVASLDVARRRKMPDLRIRGIVSLLGGAAFIAMVLARPAASAVVFALLAILGYRELIRLRWAIVHQEHVTVRVARGPALLRTFLPIAVALSLFGVGAAYHTDALMLASTLFCLAMVVRPALLAWAYPLQIGVGFWAAVLIRYAFPDDPGVLLIALVTTWSCDIGAYLIGSRWGRTPFAPSISPKKSWEGAVGGLGASILVGLVAGALDHHAGLGAAFGAVAGTVGQIGDLVQSRFKRRAGAKDSGGLLPGHGGVLDRFDSFLVNAPVCYLIAVYFW